MVWGCPSHVKKHEIDKLKYKTELCRFVRYPKNTFGYYFYRPEEQSKFITKWVNFFEDEYFLRRDSESKIVLEEVSNPNTNATSSHENSIPEQVQVHTQVPHRSERVPKQSDRYVWNIVTDNVNTLHLKDSDPLTYSEAIKDFNSRIWQEVMDSKIKSMHRNYL